MKRFLRKALIGLAYTFAVFIVFLILFYAEEDWRGARDWAACQKELQAKGETLDLRQLAPPGKPEDDLSKVPLFAEMYQANQEYDKTKKPFGDLRINQLKVELKQSNYSEIPKTVNYFKGDAIDLAAWQKYYRSISESHLPKQVGTPAQEVLQALSQFDPELDEINTAVTKPNAFWPINYESPFEGYLGGIVRMIQIAKIIQLKAVAHLDNHEIDLAEKGYLFSFRLNQPLSKGCFTMNYLIMAGVRTIDDSILWEGLHRHAWNDTQLHEMESALASIDMLALAADSFRTERSSAVKTILESQSDHDLIRKAIANGGDGLVFLYLTASVRPSGWWNEDLSAYSQATQFMINGIDLRRGKLASITFPYHPVRGWLKAGDASIWSELYTPMSAVSLPFLINLGPKIAKAETYRRLARLACRLEEYRLVHGNQYPDKLDELPDLPAHLNQEVLSEQPLRYQRKGDGYLLYSLGWNQKDDGGMFATDSREGDWAWPSP